MATLIPGSRAVSAWRAGIDQLTKDKGQSRNLVLELSQPGILLPGDRALIDAVDAALRAHADLSINTVMGTIFPFNMYRRYGRPDFYEHFLALMSTNKKKGTWGTYATRMMQRRGKVPGEFVNPLEQIIGKLQRAASGGRAWQATYELGVVEPADDLDEVEGEGLELPTFDVVRDGAQPLNIPCLSHLSFKLTRPGTLDLSVMYRSHYYLQRALGNLLGLGQLMNFVAKESGMQVGTLTCLSTHAQLDVHSWGGATSAGKILASLPQTID